MFDLLGLDADLEIIQIMRCTNIQWSRKYYESGNFSLQIPVEHYDKNVIYVYCKDRPEVGKIETRQYIGGFNKKYVQVSGRFIENELSRMIVYPKGTTNITNAPSWEFKDGAAETVAIEYFNAFKRLTTASKTVDIGITAATTQGRGNYAIHYRNGENLAYKLYDILKPSEMSYRIEYNLDTNAKTLVVWQGKDRTEYNTDDNNPVKFSTKWGNLVSPNVAEDESEYKNGCIVAHSSTTNDVTTYNVQAVFNEDTDPTKIEYITSRLNPSDFASTSAFLEALRNEGANALESTPKELNLEFSAVSGSYEYMTDFDLGDLCNIEIPEIGLSAEARLIGCYEVVKKGVWSMTMEFGTPVL